FAAPESSTWRMISAPGEPPGSRVRSTPKPSDSSLFASSPACVDLPVPSPPSKVMNLPRILFAALRPPAVQSRLYIHFSKLGAVLQIQNEAKSHQSCAI